MDNDSYLFEESEIDLHNYSTGVALDYFIAYYNGEIKNGTGNAIKAIHGYGSTGSGGEIRIRLRTFLKEHSNYLIFETGEHIDGNAGYTMVYPKLPLPPISESISEKILKFCAAAGKSEDKILGEFRLYSDMEVKKAIKLLERQGKIHSKDKGKIKIYETVKP